MGSLPMPKLQTFKKKIKSNKRRTLTFNDFYFIYFFNSLNLTCGCGKKYKQLVVQVWQIPFPLVEHLE